MYAYRKIPYRSLWIVCWPAAGLGTSAMTLSNQTTDIFTPHTSKDPSTMVHPNVKSS